GLDPDGRTFYLYNEYAWTRTLIDNNGRWATHHGTSAYATHYRLVTAGNVTTLTTDNSVTSVVLNRSGSSTQISVNGTSIGSTTAATINVDAGWAGTTGLNVSNTAAGAYTLTSSQLVSPGLTVNFRNLGGLQLFAGLLGGNNVVNVNGQPGILPNSQLSIATGGGNDVVTIGNGT